MPDNILTEIAYLDDFPSKSIRSGGTADVLPSDMIEVVRLVIELEIAKQGHWNQREQLSSRVDALEMQVSRMMRAIERQRSFPVVQYIDVMPRTKDVPPRVTKLPRAMVVFYAIGFLCSVTFASLLVLSSLGTTIIHPFLSLLGLVGGLGWLTTAWTDLLLSKREKLANKTERQEGESVGIPAR